MATFGELKTTPGYIAGLVRDRLITGLAIHPSAVRVVYQQQQPVMEVLRTHRFFVDVIVPSISTTDLTVSASADNMQVRAVLRIELFTMNNVDMFTRANQAVLNATSGYDIKARDIHNLLNHWFPVDSGGKSYLCQPMFGLGWQPPQIKDPDGYSVSLVNVECVFLHG